MVVPPQNPVLEREALQIQLERFGPWLHAMDLGCGLTTPVLDKWVMEAAVARKNMIWPALERSFGSRWAEVDCIDVACGEGFFTSHLSRFGPRRILAIDARQANVAKARFVAQCQRCQNVRIEVGNAYDLSPESTGTFGLCLCLGLLFHVEDPMYVIRRLRSVTRELCVIDTQVAQPDPVTFGWLGADRRLSTDCVLALHEESDTQWNESASVTGLGLIPSEPALRRMLLHAGFRKLEKLPPVESSFDAFMTGDRVIFLAWV